MAAEGKSTRQIARTLNGERVPTPMQQKRAAGCSRTVWPCIHEDNFWGCSTIRIILNDERYTGMNIFGKRMRDEVGKRHTVKNSRSEWIRVENTHESIISKEEFDAVQAKMRRTGERGSSRPGGIPLRGKVRCGVCGYAMKRSRGKDPYYFCDTPRVTDAYACPVEHVMETDLMDAVLKELRVQALYAVDISRIWEEKRGRKKRDMADMRRSISRLEESFAGLESYMRELYEKFAFGELDKDRYLLEKSRAVEKKDRISARIAEQKAALQNASANARLDNRFADSFAKYTEIEELTADITADVLQEIIVYPDRVINIVWNYRDELEKLLLDINMEEEFGNAED